MSEEQVIERLDNLDRRVDRIEQFLPTLATKAEARALIDEAVAPLATRDEVRALIDEAVAPLATKAELCEEGERSRRHMLMLFEDMRAEVRLFMESHNLLERRVAKLESRGRRRVQ